MRRGRLLPSDGSDDLGPTKVGRVVSSLLLFFVAILSYVLTFGRQIRANYRSARLFTLGDIQRLASSSLTNMYPVFPKPAALSTHRDYFNGLTNHFALGSRSSHAREGAVQFRSGRDPLAQHRAVVGPDIGTTVFQRLRGIFFLLIIIVILGSAIAGIVLLALAFGRILLETLAS